jgi:pimeloyl-ACP methyl ester carboxylesterase
VVLTRAMAVDGATLQVREAGEADGEPVIHFHGTPGSRLELAWADEVVAAAGVRMITFDRPGYGGSTQGPFSLRSIADLALELADRLGLGRFRTSGWSGGSPFALATAATAPERVEAVGLIACPGPYQLVPGALQGLSEGDRTAAGLLPEDPQGAAAAFVEGFDFGEALASVESLSQMFEPTMCEWDRAQWKSAGPVRDAVLTNLREAVKSGVLGCGWDNVAWIGPWDVDPSLVRCPVLLWYGGEDHAGMQEHARWLDENLPDARLVVWQGEGHLLPFAHLPEILQELLASNS